MNRNVKMKKCRLLPALLAAAFILFSLAGCSEETGFIGEQTEKLGKAMDYFYSKGLSAERIVREVTGKDPGEEVSAVGQAAQSITEEITEAARDAAQSVVDEAAEAAEEAVHNVVEETRKSIIDRIIGMIREVFS